MIDEESSLERARVPPTPPPFPSDDI